MNCKVYGMIQGQQTRVISSGGTEDSHDVRHTEQPAFWTRIETSTSTIQIQSFTLDQWSSSWVSRTPGGYEKTSYGACKIERKKLYY
jgi:hypothetical protein